MISTIALAALAATLLVKVFKAIEQENYKSMFASGFEFAMLLLVLGGLK